MTKTELDKMLEKAKFADLIFGNWSAKMHAFLSTARLDAREFSYIVACSPDRTKWMGERIKELEEGLAEAYREIRRINGTPADP